MVNWPDVGFYEVNGSALDVGLQVAKGSYLKLFEVQKRNDKVPTPLFIN